MNVPEELLYTKDHEWARVEGDLAVVGITDFAQSELGDIVYLDVPSVGEMLSKGEKFGDIEAVKTVAEAYMPVSGEVVEFNEALESAPELVNASPYDEGWIVKIKFSDPSEFDTLLKAEEYKKSV